MLNRIFNWRFRALFVKELNEIRRNRRLVGMMLVPPTLNLALLGFAMNSEVTELRLGIVDESRTAQSRELKEKEALCVHSDSGRRQCLAL